jgi:hypothetical protein
VNFGFVASLLVIITAVLSVFIEIPIVSNYAFWFAVGAYIMLAGTRWRQSPVGAGLSLSVASNGLVVIALVENRRRRSRRFLISGPFVSFGIRQWPAAPNTAIAIGPRPGSIASVGRITVVAAIAARRIAVVTAVAARRITVVTAVASITIAPLDILALDVTALINQAWPARITSGTVDRAIRWIVAVSRLAATVGTGITSTIVTSAIVTSLRWCCDQRRTE